MYEDKTLTCRECSQEFIWSAGEQKFFADKGLQNPPSRCPDCRRQRKEKVANRQMFTIKCKNCDKEGEVPFQPKSPDDILCGDCFRKLKVSEKPASS